MSQEFDVSIYLSAIRRRLWMFTISVIVVSSLGLLVAYVLPPVFQSTAKVLVESPQIPGELARSTVTASADELLAKIEQRLKTRKNMIDMIERLDLYNDRPDLSLSEKVDMVRDGIEISSIRVGKTHRSSGKVSAFTITYSTNKSTISALVANELLTKVLEENRQTRNEHASETLGFFDREVDRLSRELAGVEGEITAFKRENELSLPDTLRFQRKELSDLRESILRRDSERVDLLDRRRDFEQSLKNGEAIASALTPEERRLRELEITLLERRTRFSESHPTVRSLRAQITQTRRLISPAGGSGPDLAALEQNRVNEIKQEIGEINRQIGLIDNQRRDSEIRIAMLEGALEDAPRVEMALGVLLRSRDELQVQHRNAVNKQADAAIGERLEVTQKAERFEVIEQPTVPTHPVAPKRMLIAVGGLVAAVGLGLGLVILLEMFNTSLRTAGQVHKKLDLRPIVSIPHIHTPAELARRRRIQRTTILLLVIVTPGSLYLIDQHVMPLQLVFERLLDKTGLNHVMRIMSDRISWL